MTVVLARAAQSGEALLHRTLGQGALRHVGLEKRAQRIVLAAVERFEVGGGAPALLGIGKNGGGEGRGRGGPPERERESESMPHDRIPHGRKTKGLLLEWEPIRRP